MGHNVSQETIPLNIAVLTVSDTRTEDNDTSGQLLVEKLNSAGHKLADKKIVIDDIYKIRAALSTWIASDDTQVIIITGGTGFTSRDSTPEAVTPLLDKVVDGFGELFRQISLEQIGTSTVQSRALAGMANKTLLFCLPGSTNACRTAWDNIIDSQIDSRQGPCNFVPQLKGIDFAACLDREKRDNS
ncbi:MULTISPECIES: molybdenum cofactor biosynthesis protein B [unclassified Oleiphilus]|jgi:molybdenum cofactor biosynthesis protein B|uniref:molybdenum cofactor biosynthesis protein B n=2 Tax=Oleiphilus TaxID=141450 RepID=UPI0007C215B5|nr:MULTISPECIES: molybdenum cofactor biosynthesis protein B [unclassified Oleiphilus]KZY75163.1 molybdenum cofactor biosynthesis protein [Oleiphilus sp. HI0069]KZY82593.1 molybdenum cofactor biosynthesis protein [Oleiphilus sp. HI0068]KZY85119.1 molybdenum cofactor biosynthesis protein [Oleiphilus sp. HI0072]KZZ20805.1 molybdenum cofactor biosynthesis protein [Oleiphilus sp. HI0078]KZZ21915.1 molybdenum cofactor biosynthesis protein [Oleiphilus sp. HI0081]KZZ38750.1 molybdenum cofactor biosyn